MISVVAQELPFVVTLKTSDGEWTVKARFATRNLAGTWSLGLAAQQVDSKIFEERNGEFHEITAEAIQGAADALRPR